MAEALPPFVRQTWAVSAVLVNMVGQGMMLGFPAVLLPALKADGSVINTDLDTMSWLVSVVGLSSFPGYLISAFCMERWGRKPTQALVMVPGALGWALLALAADVPALMAGRVLGGLTNGASVVLGAIVIGEYTSPKLRGVFLGLKTASIGAGSTFVHTIGHFYPWKTVAIFGLVTQVVAIAMVCTWPESPTWLAARSQFDRSETAWIWLRGHGAKSKAEFDSIIEAQKQRLTVQMKPDFKKHIVNFLQKFTKKDFLRPLLIIPFAVIVKEACGKNLFPAYALQIIQEITGDKSKSFYYTLAIDLTTTFSAGFSSALARVLKRRTLLFATGGASLVVLAAICTYVYLTDIEVISKDRAWLPVLMFMLYFLLTNLGCTVIPLALLGEIFPVAHKGAGSAVSGLALALSLMLALKVTPVLLITVKVYGTFAIFGSAMGISLLVLYFILPETKDRTLQQIEDYFHHGRFIDDEKVLNDEEEHIKMLKK